MPSIKNKIFYAAILFLAAIFALIFAPKTQALSPSADKFGVTFSSITIGNLGIDSDTSASARTTILPSYLVPSAPITLSWNSTVSDSRFDHYQVKYGCTTQNDTSYSIDNYTITANTKNKSISWTTPNAQPILYCKIWVYAMTADDTRIGGANTRLFQVGTISPRAAAAYDYSANQNTGVIVRFFAHMNGNTSARFGFQIAENPLFTNNLKSFNDAWVYNNVSGGSQYNVSKTLSTTDYTFSYGKNYYYRATWYDPIDAKYYHENSYKTITINAQTPTITLPAVQTATALGTTYKSTQLVAKLTSLGGDKDVNTKVYFEYYCTQCAKPNIKATTGGVSASGIVTPGNIIIPVGGDESLYPDLEPNTTYYYKAYAFNTVGTYTNASLLSFKTNSLSGPVPNNIVTLPSVNTSINYVPAQGYAYLTGNLTSLGGASSAEVGFYVWKKSAGFNASEKYSIVSSKTDTDWPFYKNLSATDREETTWCVAAYAKNTKGEAIDGSYLNSDHCFTIATTPTPNPTPQPSDVIKPTVTTQSVSYDKTNNTAFALGRLDATGNADSNVWFNLYKSGYSPESGIRLTPSFSVMNYAGPFYYNIPSSILDKSIATTYCVKAYASNSAGTQIATNVDPCFTTVGVTPSPTPTPDTIPNPTPNTITYPQVKATTVQYVASTQTLTLGGSMTASNPIKSYPVGFVINAVGADYFNGIHLATKSLTSGSWTQTFSNLMQNPSIAYNTTYQVRAYFVFDDGSGITSKNYDTRSILTFATGPKPGTAPTPAPTPTPVQSFPQVKALTVNYIDSSQTLTLTGSMTASSPAQAYPVGFVINKVGTNLYSEGIHLATKSLTSGNWTQTFSNLMQNYPQIEKDTQYQVRAYWIKSDPAAGTQQKMYDTRSILIFHTSVSQSLWPRVTLEGFTYEQDGSISLQGNLAETGGSGNVSLEFRYYNVQKGGSPTNYQKVVAVPTSLSSSGDFQGAISKNNIFPDDTYCFQAVAKNNTTGKEANSGAFVCRYNPPTVVTEKASKEMVSGSGWEQVPVITYRATVWTKEKNVFLKLWWKYIKMTDTSGVWKEVYLTGYQPVGVHANGQGYAWDEFKLPFINAGYCVIPYAQKVSSVGKILSEVGQGAPLCYPAGPWIITLETIKPIVLTGNQLTFTALGEITNFNGLTSADTYFMHGTRETESSWMSSIATQKVNKPANAVRAKFEKQIKIDTSKVTSDQYCYKACAVALAGSNTSQNCGEKFCFFISDIKPGSNPVINAASILKPAPFVILESVNLNNPPTSALVTASAWFSDPVPPQTTEYWFSWGVEGTDKSTWKETTHLFKTIPTNNSHYISDTLTPLDSTKTYCFNASARVVDSSKQPLTEVGQSLSDLCFPNVPWVITRDFSYDKATKKADLNGEVTNFFGKPSVNTWFKYYPRGKEGMALTTQVKVTTPNQPNGHALFSEKGVDFSAMTPGLDEQFCFRACAKNINGTKTNCGEERCFGGRQGEESNIQVAKKATALQTKSECQQVEVELTLQCTTPKCYNVVVYDVMPSGVSYVQNSAVPPVSYIWDNGKKLVWSMGDLNQGNYTIEFRQKMPNAQKQLADVYPDSKVTYDSIADNGTRQNIEKPFPETYVDNILSCDEVPPPPPPPPSTPFSVDKKAYFPESGNCQQARVELTVRCGIGEEKKTPVDVMLVLDRSASMSGKPMDDLKAATKEFIDKLDKAVDRVGVASYSTSGTLDKGLTNGVNKFSEVKAAIDGLQSAGNTSISQGLDKARQELETNGRPEAQKVIILFTDGAPNVDLNGKAVDFQQGSVELEQLSKSIKDKNIKIYTIGLLSNLGNDQTLIAMARELLKKIASSSDKYYESPTSIDLAKIYDEIAQRMRDGTSGEKCIMVEVQDQLVRDKMWLRGRFWSSYNGLAEPLIVPDHFDETDRRINWTIGDMMPGDVAVLKFEVTFETADANQLVNIIQNSWARYTSIKGLKITKLFPETKFSPKACPTMPTTAAASQCVYGATVYNNAQKTLYWFSGIKTDPSSTTGRKYYSNLADVKKELASLYASAGNKSFGTCVFAPTAELQVYTYAPPTIKVSNGAIYTTLKGRVTINARYSQVKTGFMVYKRGYPGFSYNIDGGTINSGLDFEKKDVVIKPWAVDYVYKAYAKSLDGTIIGWGQEQTIPSYNTNAQATGNLNIVTSRPIANNLETTFYGKLSGVPAGQKATIWFSVYPRVDSSKPFVVGYDSFGNGDVFIKIPTMVISGKPYCYKANVQYGNNATTTALNEMCF